MTELAKLIALRDSGELHHITYRRGTVWEGLWFYRKSDSGFRGFEVAGCVNKSDPDYELAYKEIAGLGIHIGCFGGG
jgi:hypothetical protein